VKVEASILLLTLIDVDVQKAAAGDVCAGEASEEGRRG